MVLNRIFINHKFIILNTNIFLGVISSDELPAGFDQEQSTFIEKLGAGTDKFLQEFFCKWGTGNII